MDRSAGFVATLMLAAALLFRGPLAANAAPAPAPAARTFHVQAGAASADKAIQVPMFFPNATTIDAGDSITWSDGTDLQHTVSFGQAPAGWGKTVPLGGSSYDGTGFLTSGTVWEQSATAGYSPKSYTLTFTEAGTFKYYCLFHAPAMTGSVVVQPAGSPYPATQATYQATSDSRLAPALQAGAAALAAQQVTTTPNGDGTTTYQLNAGYGDGQSYVLTRFGAARLSIHTGDTVAWTQNELADVHTVTFLDHGQDVPFQLPGDPNLNPAAIRPAEGKVYRGTGFFNSGLLPPRPAPVAKRTYALTFATPGAYTYQCLFHDDLGMKGTIEVQLASPRSMPNTGDGGIPFAAETAAVLLGLLLIGSWLVTWRRSRPF